MASIRNSIIAAVGVWALTVYSISAVVFRELNPLELGSEYVEAFQNSRKNTSLYQEAMELTSDMSNIEIYTMLNDLGANRKRDPLRGIGSRDLERVIAYVRDSEL